MDAKIWIYNHVLPLFHSKIKSIPLRASGVAQSLPPPQKWKNSKIQLKIKIQTSNIGFLVMDHPSFIPGKTIPLDHRGGSREGGLFSTADLQKYKILMWNL